MDPEARQYQDQLHQVNQERMRRFENKLDQALKILSSVASDVENVPELEKRVKALEEDKSFRKGVMAAIAFLGTLIGASLSEAFKALFHHLIGK